MARPSHQHTVSAGYLRFFSASTDRGAHVVQLFDIAARTGRQVSVRDALVRRDHNSVMIEGQRDDHVEHEWRRVESEMLPYIRAMVEGEISPYQEPRAVVALMAIHLARGAGTELVHHHIVKDALRREPERMAKNRKLRKLAHPDVIHEAAHSALDALHQSRQLRVEAMVRHYNWFCERFEDYSVQAVRPRRPAVGFVTSDNPTVLSDKRRIRVGVQNLAVLDADEAYIALSPTLLVALCERPVDDLVLSPSGVQLLNQTTRRAAVRWLVARPGENVARAAL